MILQLFLALALTVAALFPLLGCSTVGEAPGLSQMPSSLPDISGVAWIAGSRFLAVHDTKDQRGRPRVSIVELPESPTGLTSQPVELSWPGPRGLASDLESVARIPGTSLILLLESGSAKRSGTPLRRIFLVEHRDRVLEIVDVTDWPVPVDNVEGAAVAHVGEQLIFLFAERAEGQGSTALRWAPVTARPLAFGSFQEVRFTSPDPTGRNARPVTAIEIDEIGRIYVVSAVDPGTDNGPFRSVIWRIGRMEADGSGRPRVILDENPRQLATVDGFEVEGLALREDGDREPDIFFGTDDENYGGILRLIPGKFRRRDGALSLRGAPSHAACFFVDRGQPASSRRPLQAAHQGGAAPRVKSPTRASREPAPVFAGS